MKKDRFNNYEPLTQLNLGHLAYHIEKGNLDTTNPITMRHLMEAGVVSKIEYGLKVLGGGSQKFEALKTPVNLEVSDASASVIKMIRQTGGSIHVKYMTPLILRNHIKPYKFSTGKELKVPMPPPKQVRKLENFKKKGLTVSYPRAPWFTDNEDAHKKDREDRATRIKEGQHADLLESLPAYRRKGTSKNKVRVEKQDLPISFKFQ